MSNNTHHPHYLRFHEGLNILSQEIDRIRSMHVVSEQYALPADKHFQQGYKLDEMITLLGLSLLKERYLELLGQLEQQEAKHRPSLRKNHLLCLQQIESFLNIAHEQVSQIGSLQIRLAYKTDAPIHENNTPEDPLPNDNAAGQPSLINP